MLDKDIAQVLRKIAREVGARPAEGALERVEFGRREKAVFYGAGRENLPENCKKVGSDVRGAKTEKIETSGELRNLLFGRWFRAALGTLLDNFNLQNSPVARALGLRPQSALVFGPSGAGKTQLVHEVCRAFPGLAAFRVNSTQIYSQYVGESEQNLLKVFAAARRAAPALLVFDHVDALFGRERGKGDQTGVTERVLA